MKKKRLPFTDEPPACFSDILILLAESGIPLHQLLQAVFSGELPGYDKRRHAADDPEFEEFVQNMCTGIGMSRSEFEEAILNGSLKLKVKTGPLPLSGFNEEKEPTFH
jgi:hypothetical protein